MTFRLATLFYLFAVVAASLGVLGGWGIVPAVLVLGFWFPAQFRKEMWPVWLLFALYLGFGFLMQAVSLTQPRTDGLRSWSVNSCKQLLLAMLNYEATNGQLPPHCVTDAEGNKLFSWRVALLPFLDEQTIYDQLHLDEPWDSSHNKPLLDRVDASVFSSPRLVKGNEFSKQAHFLAVVGDDTPWPEVGNRKLRDVKDGTSNTVALIEVGGLDIHWAEPRDLWIEEGIATLQGSPPGDIEVVVEDYFVTRKYVQNIRILGYLDGSVRLEAPTVDRESARALLSVADEDKAYFAPDPERRNRRIETITHWDRIVGVSVLIAIILLPCIPVVRHHVMPTLIKARSDTAEATS